ncbi:hypothetical protein YC2023_090063 [Brassica napus]
MSYAMEMFPTKISKAVFISAVMLANGQSTLDLFNQKDIALASVYIRPIPFAPVGEKLHVFYIKTMKDYAVSVPLQEAMNTN